MLTSLGVEAVVLGHSERRALFAETDEALARKVPAALAAGLEPILCVGESEAAARGGRDRGRPAAPARGRPRGGRGRAARLGGDRVRADLGDRHRQDRDARAGRGGLRASSARWSRSATPAPREAVRVLYGGSVKPDNAAELLGQPRHRRRPGRRSEPRPGRLPGDLRSGVTVPAGPTAIPVPSLALIILDGWGLAPAGPGQRGLARATRRSSTSSGTGYPHTELSASGRDVGLPDGQMGNSEVGHLNLGAGAVVKQDLARIDDAIADGSFFENEALLAACDAARRSPRGRLHLMGLVSDGGVHSGWEHIEALIELAAQEGVPDPVVHVFTDGRDTLPRSAPGYVRGARALAAPGRADRDGQRPLLRDGSRPPLGADEARLRRDRPRARASRRRDRRARRSRRRTRRARPTSSCARP